MKTNTRTLLRSGVLLFMIAVIAVVLSSCTGPDALRIRADRANHALATRCADGWFGSLPVTADDQRLVRNALGDWEKRIDADEQAGGSR